MIDKTLEQLQQDGQWTGKVYLVQSQYGFIAAWEHGDMDGYTVIGEAEVTIPVTKSREDITREQIEVLRSQKQTLLAESQRKADEIEQQIQSLLAIEHKPGAAEQQED